MSRMHLAKATNAVSIHAVSPSQWKRWNCEHLVRSLLQTLAFLFVLATNSVGLIGDDSISFSRDIRPILSDRCFHCHGPDAENQESDFRLDTAEHAYEDLGGYAGIVPGDLDASELHLRIRSDSEDERMPPPDAVRQLSDSEKDLLDRWIQQGAKFEKHWAFRPIPTDTPIPELPEVKTAWAVNPIDIFVIRKLVSKDLTPNRSAPKEKWMRRVTFDLTGLPPTLEEMDEFLNDETPNAHEHVVDRLLNSKPFAERMTSEWLDVARYSDSYGYQRDDYRLVWPYRDWVIRAFESNMPYDQFVTEQLAGDLLPDANQDQQLATVFNRLHSHKKEGGSDPEEFRTEYVADRTNTVGAAFMGLTFECAKCHDHKYDPLKTKEYYELGSFFSNIDEYGIISFFTNATPTPAMPLVNEAQQKALDEAKRTIENAEAKLTNVLSQTDDLAAWLKSDLTKEPNWLQGCLAHISFDNTDEKNAEANSNAPKPNAPKPNPLANEIEGGPTPTTAPANKIVTGKIGSAIHLTGDDPVTIPEIAHFSRDQPFSFALWMKASESTERSVIYRRSRGWDDAGHIGYELTKTGDKLSAKICHFWPGDAIGIETSAATIEANQWIHVAVTYDGSSRANGLQMFLNGEPAKTTIVQDHLTRQIKTWSGGEGDFAIGTRYRDRGFKDGTVDEFYAFDRQLSTLEIMRLAEPQFDYDRFLAQIQSNEQHQAIAEEHYWLVASTQATEARSNLQQTRRAWNDLMDKTSAVSVMREAFRPVDNHVLVRGQYNEKGEPVSADTPAFLPDFPNELPRNRLGLSKWLTSPNHPLLARVTVNRYWQLMFGRGLVSTPEDFGLQGSPPTHPELLDWLARDFIESKWDLRALLKKMALSATYRQSSIVAQSTRDKDPENLWLARGTSRMIDAEMVRDNALFVSGLLKSKTGGPPVKPYDLSASFKPTKVDQGDGLYRRSLYTFWQRSAPAPVMMTMNANKRDVCRVKREPNPSPLQALVLLNGPQFVEAARVFASKLLSEWPAKAQTSWLIENSFRQLTSRQPNENELRILTNLFNEQLDNFTHDPDAARQLLTIGDSKTDNIRSAPVHAALTVVVNAMMNLDESVRHQ